MFKQLEEINRRPKPFQYYTAADLWTEEHTSKQMLAYHLNDAIDASSRNSGFMDRSVDWIASRFNLGPGVKTADFGCGPGLYAIRLARLGAEATGIDFSRRSLDHAREAAAREGLAIEYVQANYLEYEAESRFDLITMIMCDLCALSPAQRRTMLTKFHRLLKPGGWLLFDAYSLQAFGKREETAVYEANQLNGFWSAAPYYGFMNTFKYELEKVVLDKYTIVEDGRIRTVYNWLQYFAPEELEGELADAGFGNLERYADVAGSPHDPAGDEFALAAQKAGLGHDPA